MVAWKGNLGAAVKLLPCDHKVMGSSPGKSVTWSHACQSSMDDDA
jgi:hypothetical protein